MHRSCVRLSILFFLISLPLIFASAQARPRITVLRSAGAKGNLDADRVRRALQYTADELRIADRLLPRIVVVHGCPQSAEVVNLKYIEPVEGGVSGGVIAEKYTDDPVYFLWVIGRPNDNILAEGMANILVKHFELPRDRVSPVTLKVVHRMRNVVAAADLTPAP